MVDACKMLYDGLNWETHRKPMPCVYQSIAGGRRLDTWDSDGMEYDLRFEFFTDSRMPDLVSTMMDVFGNSMDYADLDFSDGEWYTIGMQRLNQTGPMFADNIWRGTMEYTLRVGRMKAAPALRLA